MAANSHTLLIDEVMPVGEEMLYESLLQHVEHLWKALPWLGERVSADHEPPTALCILHVLHQTQVVQMAPGSSAKVLRLAHIQGLERARPAARKHIDAGLTLDLVQIDRVDEALATPAKRNGLGPLDG